MPLRIVLIFSGLFLGCVAVVLLAWAIGSEFYIFIPSFRMRPAHRPPDHPAVVLGLLMTCLALYFYSPTTSLTCFTVLLCGLLLGSIVGYAVFQWRPTVMQILLTVAMIAEATYGWSIQNYYLEEQVGVNRFSAGEIMNRTLMFLAMTLGGYVGWWAGEAIGFGLMGTFLVSSLGSIVGVVVAWKIMVSYLD